VLNIFQESYIKKKINKHIIFATTYFKIGFINLIGLHIKNKTVFKHPIWHNINTILHKLIASRLSQ